MTAQATTTQKYQVVDLLGSIETGDRGPVASIDPDKYIQHNLGAADGLAGFGELMSNLPKGSGRANPVRVFQDGDLVFTHTDYDFFGPKVGFDIFRFENGRIVEHWDNLQDKPDGPNPSGHTMLDGPTEATDLDKTEQNKALVRNWVDDFFNGRAPKFAGYFDGDNYIQHNPQIGDGLTGLVAAFEAMKKQGMTLKFEKIHKVLGEGNFVLVLIEAVFSGQPTSFYGLFRVEDGKIAEHWGTMETIPDKKEWKNSNGKF